MENWNKTNKNKHTKYVNDRATPSKHILRLHEGLKQWESTQLIRLRIGIVPLNYYLFKIKRSTTDKCHCGKYESLNHALFECKTYSKERMFLKTELAKVQIYTLDRKSIFTRPKSLKAVMKFIKKFWSMRYKRSL